MGKSIASGYSQPDVTVCGNCFHKGVCGDKDYLTENSCCNFVENGLLVRLPCKVGDAVWVLYHYYESDTVHSGKTKALPAEVTNIETRHFWAGGKDLSHIKVCYEILDTEFLIEIGRRHEAGGWHYWDDNFIHLTHEEAEAAMREGTK